MSVEKLSGCARKFIVSAAKSVSFNEREFQPPQPKRSWKECSTRSTSGPAQERAGASRQGQGLGWAVMVTQPPQWYDEKDDHSPWIKALAEVRIRATRGVGASNSTGAQRRRTIGYLVVEPRHAPRCRTSKYNNCMTQRTPVNVCHKRWLILIFNISKTRRSVLRNVRGEEHLLLRQHFRARQLHRYCHLHLLSSLTRRAIM